MKRNKLFRSLLAFLLAAAMLMPAMPAAQAANEVKCEKEGCDGICSETVLMEATCNSVGVIEYVCVKCNHSFLVKTEKDPDNHDSACIDNGDGATHTASCRYCEDYQKVKEEHTFEQGYCVKCGAADYSQAEIVVASDEIEISVDLDAEEAELTIGKISVMVGTADITKDYDITYNWYDGKNKVVSTNETYQLPLSVTAKLGDYSYACFVMATPKNSNVGKRLSATCMITVHVLDLVSASAIVGSRQDDFTLGSINTATSISVMEQIYQSVYDLSEGYPSYVVFDRPEDSEIGQLKVNSSRYYFVANDGQKKLSEVEFVPREDGSGNYVIGFTAYDTKGEAFPGVLMITVERELGELDVAYFGQQGELITLNATDFELFWQECNPGGQLQRILFLDLPVATEGVFYYNYRENSKNNTKIELTDEFHVLLSSANLYLIDGVTFVPAGKHTGQITIPFNAFGLSGRGNRVLETGELSIFISSGEVEAVKYSMTSGNKLTLDGDAFLEVYRETTGSKSTDFSIKLLDVPEKGDLYIDYTGKGRDIALNAETVSDYTFYYNSVLSREIEDLTYVSTKSNKAVTETLRYVVCDSKGEFVYLGEIIIACKSAVVVYTKSFTDVKKGDWFYPYIMDLAEAGVINGIPEVVNGKTVYSYKPQNPNPDPDHPELDEPYQVTYGAALKLIMLAVGYAEQTPTSEHWASGYLALALEEELVSAVLTEARLDDQITRRMVAQIAARAMNLPKSTREESPFKDIDIPEPDATDVNSTYARYILSLYDAGIINGDQNGMFNGTSKITRAEMATIVWRIYNYEG